jgi:hypothetical protein
VTTPEPAVAIQGLGEIALITHALNVAEALRTGNEDLATMCMQQYIKMWEQDLILHIADKLEAVILRLKEYPYARL